MNAIDKSGLGQRPSPQPQLGKGQPDLKPSDVQPKDTAKSPPDKAH